ncbi:hypothetical protein SAMN05421832_10690 [Psychrobacillus psychrodurans]|nr:hypothetical protein SAMN05421832_10690 [Psychrobacillus psychrodurans]
MKLTGALLQEGVKPFLIVLTPKVGSIRREK